MSVLHLRRDMVVAEEPIVEIETPFPLVRIDSAEAANPSPKSGGSFARSVGQWMRGLIVLGALSVYPGLVIISSDVGDENVSDLVDRTEWSAPWAGGAATLVQHHYQKLGWASDAPGWAPMGLLTGKPAYQSALAESVGEFVNLVARQHSAAGQPDADLEAAARLLNANSSGVQLRASRDALISYDGRMRRRSGEPEVGPAEVDNRFATILSWGKRSQGDLVRTSAMISGSPMDEAATRAVYAAKGRAQAAYLFIDTIAWPEDSRATAARSKALEAWKIAAEFHPMLVFNGSPDGALFGNHASSMGFLVGQAVEATEDYRTYFQETSDALTNVAAAQAVNVPTKPGTSAN